MIYVMDYEIGEVVKVDTTEKALAEIQNDFNDEIEDWLKAHEKEIGVNMKESYWMCTDEETVRSVTI